MDKRKVTIPLILLLFLVLGIFLRLASGHPLLSASLTYSPGTRNILPGTATPEDTARSFYIFIDEGEVVKIDTRTGEYVSRVKE